MPNVQQFMFLLDDVIFISAYQRTLVVLDNIAHGGFDEPAKHYTSHKEQGIKWCRRS